ncbi:hypothetical protein V6N12_026990 [Hibiscus sabdariffa]|uniref:Uncharacterized protein n=1 Tax=Hibiscus sabdariffa TaxID=183260 RepID=A0ABR2DTF5_9ROSI
MDGIIGEMRGRQPGERFISVNKAQHKMGKILTTATEEDWDRDCPSAGGGGGMLSSCSRYEGPDDRGDHFRDRDS